MTREFDLNIERVLENWTVAHALREVIANALDEQALTGTTEPEIVRDSQGCWHVRDWGRGLRYALATFDRHDIAVAVRTRHGDITTGKQAKHGFADIQTLHAQFTFISPAEMTWAERETWGKLSAIFAIRGGRPNRILDVRVSETMRLVEGRYQEAVGLWDETEGRIIVKRSQLLSLATFAGTVLHEVSHALSGAPDVSMEFEQMLTEELGAVVARQLQGAR